MEVHIIRHTPVDLKKNICYGRIDVPLSNSFVSDCENIKKKLSKNYDIVFISPSKRCVELAKKLGYKTFITDEKLLELNFGDWEGKEWDKINQKQLNKWMKKFVNVAPPNGESFLNMFNRMGSPDFLIVNGSSQIYNLTKFLNWPQKKLIQLPSLRYSLDSNEEFKNIIFLPWKIFNSKKVLEDFELFLEKLPEKSLQYLKVKTHPICVNKKSQDDFKKEIEKIISKYSNKFTKNLFNNRCYCCFRERFKNIAYLF